MTTVKDTIIANTLESITKGMQDQMDRGIFVGYVSATAVSEWQAQLLNLITELKHQIPDTNDTEAPEHHLPDQPPDFDAAAKAIAEHLAPTLEQLVDEKLTRVVKHLWDAAGANDYWSDDLRASVNITANVIDDVLRNVDR